MSTAETRTLGPRGTTATVLHRLGGETVGTFVALLEFTDDEPLRLQTRPSHRAYLRKLLDDGKLFMSGPWVDDSGALLVYEATDADEAKRLLAADPYRQAGVLSNATIKEWHIVMQAAQRGEGQ